MSYTSEKQLFVNSDRSQVVPGDSPDAAFLLVGEGGELPDEEAEKYGLAGRKRGARAADPEEPTAEDAETEPRARGRR